jgi:hypothetical protein
LRHRIRDGIQGTSFAFPELNGTANFTITGMGELLLVREMDDLQQMTGG